MVEDFAEVEIDDVKGPLEAWRGGLGSFFFLRKNPSTPPEEGALAAVVAVGVLLLLLWLGDEIVLEEGETTSSGR